MIQFENATRTYGNKVAVSDLSLTIPSGELFALLGPNGAGKTTTIKMLVGLLRPSSGVIRVCGHDLITETRSAHLHLGYVPDEPYLYDKLTGHEFLRFIADMYRIPQDLSQERIRREIDRFELHEFADELAENYSLGMRQRLVFAAAFLHDPDVLVLDEPMVGLDPQHARVLKDILREQAEAGVTVFVSTHQLSVAEEMADRIGIMHQVRLVAVGSHDELQAANRDNRLESIFLSLTNNGS